MGFSLKNVVSGIKNVVSDAANLGAAIATKPFEAVTGKNIVTPKFSATGIGGIAQKIDNINTAIVKIQTDVTKKVVAENGGLGKIAGTALPAQIVANAEVQKLLGQLDSLMPGNTGIAGGTAPSTLQVQYGFTDLRGNKVELSTKNAADIGRASEYYTIINGKYDGGVLRKIELRDGYVFGYSGTVSTPDYVVDPNHWRVHIEAPQISQPIMQQPIIKIGAAPGASIPTSLNVENDLFGSKKKKEEEKEAEEEANKWYNKIWAWMKDPNNLWAVITFPAVLILAILWLVFGKKGRSSKRRY